MNKKQIPQDALDLIIGYSKNQKSASIPFCINYIIAAYFVKKIEFILFNLKFENAGVDIGGGAITSIYSKFVIKNENNDKYFKIVFNIGKSLEIEILAFKSQIKAFGKTYSIENLIGNPWKFGNCTESNGKKIENIYMILAINRETQCICDQSDGSLKIYFRNSMKNNEEKIEWTEPENIHWRNSDGLFELRLPDSIDWNSDEEMIMKAYNIDNIEIMKNEFANLACNDYGFGRQCCYWAAYEYYPDIEEEINE